MTSKFCEQNSQIIARKNLKNEHHLFPSSRLSSWGKGVFESAVEIGDGNAVVGDRDTGLFCIINADKHFLPVDHVPLTTGISGSE